MRETIRTKELGDVTVEYVCKSDGAGLVQLSCGSSERPVTKGSPHVSSDTRAMVEAFSRYVIDGPYKDGLYSMKFTASERDGVFVITVDAAANDDWQLGYSDVITEAVCAIQSIRAKAAGEEGVVGKFRRVMGIR